MERDAAEKEMDGVTDTDEEIPDGGFAKSSQCEDRETDEDGEQEGRTAGLKSQDTPNPATPQDSGIGDAEFCGSTESKEEAEEASDDPDSSQVINQEEDDETAKEEQQQHMNGESGWRSVGSGRKCKLKSSGSFSEQSSQTSYSSIQKGNAVSSGGGGRHKQTRRRNHHHQQNRGRRRTGNQLVLAFKEMLSESLSLWFISYVYMMIEIIVTLTHNCGVAVEAGGMKLYNLGQQLFVKVTDVPGMKADAGRVLKWTKCTGADLLDKIVRSAKWVKTAALTCFGLFCTLVLLGSCWTKSVLVRLGGERGKRYWTALQESRLWNRVASLLERVRSRFRRKEGHAAQTMPESPGRAARGPSGQELERLLALAEVPEDDLDPFTVLGVEVNATEAELKKAYRQLAVQVCVCVEGNTVRRLCGV